MRVPLTESAQESLRCLSTLVCIESVDPSAESVQAAVEIRENLVSSVRDAELREGPARCGHTLGKSSQRLSCRDCPHATECHCRAAPGLRRVERCDEKLDRPVIANLAEGAGSVVAHHGGQRAVCENVDELGNALSIDELGGQPQEMLAVNGAPRTPIGPQEHDDIIAVHGRSCRAVCLVPYLEIIVPMTFLNQRPATPSL